MFTMSRSGITDFGSDTHIKCKCILKPGVIDGMKFIFSLYFNGFIKQPAESENHFEE